MCKHAFISSTLIQRASAAAPNPWYECKWRWGRFSSGCSSLSAHSMLPTASGHLHSLTCTCVCACERSYLTMTLGCVSVFAGTPHCPGELWVWRSAVQLKLIKAYNCTHAVDRCTNQEGVICVSDKRVTVLLDDFTKPSFKCLSVAQGQPTVIDFN